MKRLGLLFIMVIFVAGIVGCGQPEPEYTPMVAAGSHHTVGLKSDGTAVAVGDNDYGQCDVENWSDMT